MKKSIAVLLAVLMLVGMMGVLAGCGDSKLDGAKTVVTVNGTEIPMGVLSLDVRYQQANMENLYSYFGYADFWDTVADEETGETMGQQQVNNSLTHVEEMELYRQKAADYDISISADDQKKIDEAAKAFMEANSEEAIQELAVTEDQVKTYLEMQMIQKRIQNALEAEAPVEITDDEANQTTFTYISMSIPEETPEEKCDILFAEEISLR